MSDGESSAVFHLPSDLFCGDDVSQPAVSSTCLLRQAASKPSVALEYLLCSQCKSILPRKCCSHQPSGVAEDANNYGTVEDSQEPSTLLLYQHSRRSRGSSTQSSSYNKKDDKEITVLRTWQSDNAKSSHGCTGSGPLEGSGKTFLLDRDMAIPGHSPKPEYYENKIPLSACCPVSSMTLNRVLSQYPAQLFERKDNTPVCSARTCVVFSDAQTSRSTCDTTPLQPPRYSTREQHQIDSLAKLNKEAVAETKRSDDSQVMDFVAEIGYGTCAEQYDGERETATRRADTILLENFSARTHGNLSTALSAGVSADRKRNNRLHPLHEGQDGTPGTMYDTKDLFGRMFAKTNKLDADVKRSSNAISLPLAYQRFLKETHGFITTVQKGALLPALFPFPADNNEHDTSSLTRRRVIIQEEDWGTQCMKNEMLGGETGTVFTDLPRHPWATTPDEETSLFHNLLSIQHVASLREGTASTKTKANRWAVFLNAASQEHLREGLRPLSSIEWSAAVAITVHLYAKKMQAIPHRKPHGEKEDYKTAKEHSFSGSWCDAFYWDTGQGGCACSARAAEELTAPSTVIL